MIRFRAWAWALPLMAAGGVVGTALAQDPARRLGSIVGVAVDEYAKAFDANGRMIAPAEYTETLQFLAEARRVASEARATISGEARAWLDSLAGAADAKRPPHRLDSLRTRFLAALGPGGAIELPSAPLDVARGRRLYVNNCAGCHGMRGGGAGAAAGAGVQPAPPAIGNVRATPDLTAEMMYNVVVVGVRGTAMPAFGATLSAQQRWEIVAYLHELRGIPMRVPSRPANDSVATLAVLAIVDSALDLVRAGRSKDGSDRALDAYLAFEPLETPARLHHAALVTTLEQEFAAFRAAAHAGRVSEAAAARQRIARGLNELVVPRQVQTWWQAFAQSFLIVLREGFEAILVVGAVVALLVRTGHRARLRSIWWGVVLGVIASAVTAVVLATLLSALPASREIVEGATMLVAVAVLFSVSYWLISRAEAAKWQAFISQQVNRALTRGGGTALGFVAFLAVYREGAETALFYQALLTGQDALVLPILLGALVGLIALGIVFTLFYRFGVKLPMRQFFMTTSMLLYALTFVFAGKGIHELQEGGAVSATPIRGAPYVDALGLYPTVESLALQLILLGLFVFALVKTLRPPAAPAAGRTEVSDGSRQTPRST